MRSFKRTAQSAVLYNVVNIHLLVTGTRCIHCLPRQAETCFLLLMMMALTIRSTPAIRSADGAILLPVEGLRSLDRLATRWRLPVR